MLKYLSGGDEGEPVLVWSGEHASSHLLPTLDITVCFVCGAYAGRDTDTDTNTKLIVLDYKFLGMDQ